MLTYLSMVNPFLLSNRQVINLIIYFLMVFIGWLKGDYNLTSRVRISSCLLLLNHKLLFNLVLLFIDNKFIILVVKFKIFWFKISEWITESCIHLAFLCWTDIWAKNVHVHLVLIHFFHFKLQVISQLLFYLN